MQNLNVTIVQANLQWANPQENINYFDKAIDSIKENNHIIVLPEMFSTGFNMKPQECFEIMNGFSMQWMYQKAAQTGAAICGSLLIKDENVFVNRFVWMTPKGAFTYYDKKHLFSLAGENKIFTPGNKRVVAELNGFRFLLQICYDLRFPVFSRNKYYNETYDYDAIIYVANWPASRSMVWKTLLKARAIENQAYVIGVNRIGNDINQTAHSGNSAIVSPKGEVLFEAEENQEVVKTILLDKEKLVEFRKSFRNAADWDHFQLLD